jgi:hypothetical protein
VLPVTAETLGEGADAGTTAGEEVSRGEGDAVTDVVALWPGGDDDCPTAAASGEGPDSCG